MVTLRLVSCVPQDLWHAWQSLMVAFRPSSILKWAIASVPGSRRCLCCSYSDLLSKVSPRHQGPHSSSLGSDVHDKLTLMPFLLVDQMQYPQVKMQSPNSVLVYFKEPRGITGVIALCPLWDKQGAQCQAWWSSQNGPGVHHTVVLLI